MNRTKNPFLEYDEITRPIYGLVSLHPKALYLITKDEIALKMIGKEVEEKYVELLSIAIQSDSKEEAFEKVLNAINGELDFYAESLQYAKEIYTNSASTTEKADALRNIDVCRAMQVLLTLLKEKEEYAKE